MEDSFRNAFVRSSCSSWFAFAALQVGLAWNGDTRDTVRDTGEDIRHDTILGWSQAKDKVDLLLRVVYPGVCERIEDFSRGSLSRLSVAKLSSGEVLTNRAEQERRETITSPVSQDESAKQGISGDPR